MHLDIYIDGGSTNNPGPAAIAFVVRDGAGTILKEHAAPIGNASNNAAEYTAFIEAVRYAKRFKPTSIAVSTDSAIVAKQLLSQFKIKEPALVPLFITAHNLMVDLGGKITVKLVDRSQNAYADRLVRSVLDTPTLL